MFSINIKKCNYILSGSKNKLYNISPFQVILDKIILERVLYTNFFGVFIDQNLDFKQYTAHTFKKVSRSLDILNEMKSILTTNLLLTLYYAMIHPYFLYCNVVWREARKLATHKLMCLQTRALRLITRSNLRAYYNKHED